LDVHLDALLGAGGHRVVEAHALDVAAVAGAAAVGDDDVVEGALLGAATGEADLDHDVFGVAQLPGWQGKPAIIGDPAAPQKLRRPPPRPGSWPRLADGSRTCPATRPPGPPRPRG